MTREQATSILQSVINVGVQRGIFNSAMDVVAAQQAFELLTSSQLVAAAEN